MRAAIVDDEPLARSRLERMLKFAGVSVVASGETGVDALHIAKDSEIDILFLDINMPQMTGIEAAQKIAESLEKPPAIVFCTAYDQYAIEAFKANAVSYLLKPFSQSEIDTTLMQAKKLTRLQLSMLSNPINDLVVVSGSEHFKLKLGDVAYFHSQDKATYAQLFDGSSILVDSTLKVLEGDLHEFCIRVHRGCLVNRSAINRIFKTDDGSWRVSLEHNAEHIPISRRHLAEVKACFESA